jgi:hypothetical protein
MKEFEDTHDEENFVCNECQRCNKLVWPPSNYCNRCFGEVTWRSVSSMGKVIEFSRKDDVVFCIAEFENEIRLMGSLECDIMPLIGQSVKLIKYNSGAKEEFVFQLMPLV